MRYKNFVGILLLLSSLGCYAQAAISGYVNQEDSSEWDTVITLSKIPLSAPLDHSKAQEIASVSITPDGYFSFDRKTLTANNAVYQLHVKRIKALKGQQQKEKQLFIASQQDSIVFHKGKTLFGTYDNTNLADAEWQRLRKFEAHFYAALTQEPEPSDVALNPIRSYTKDSLQILMVKLLSVKQLEHKALLDTDIDANPRYYLALLEELKRSDLPASEYQFLERRLAFLTQEAVAEKYTTSLWMNIILGLSVLALLAAVLIYRRRQTSGTTLSLSNQESAIRELMLQGKSNKEIASELFISISTVKTHITHIYHKLNVTNRQELLRRFQN